MSALVDEEFAEKAMGHLDMGSERRMGYGDARTACEGRDFGACLDTAQVGFVPWRLQKVHTD
jgi:hypothetical protein